MTTTGCKPNPSNVHSNLWLFLEEKNISPETSWKKNTKKYILSFCVNCKISGRKTRGRKRFLLLWFQIAVVILILMWLSLERPDVVSWGKRSKESPCSKRCSARRLSLQALITSVEAFKLLRQQLRLERQNYEDQHSQPSRRQALPVFQSREKKKPFKKKLLVSW